VSTSQLELKTSSAIVPPASRRLARTL